MSGWQPISTAPKNEWVFVCGDGWPKGVVAMQRCRRHNDELSWPAPKIYWWWDASNMPFYSDEQDDVKHWMTMPSPPEVTNDDGATGEIYAVDPIGEREG